MKNQTAHLSIKVISKCVLLILFCASFCQAEGKFTKPFILKTKNGDSLEIVDIYFDDDLRGDRIAIYTTIDGQKSFLNPEDIKNQAELERFIALDGTNSSAYVDQNQEHIPSIPPSGRVYIPSGMLSNYINALDDRDFYLTTKYGTIPGRSRDIEELCRDYVFFRNKIIEQARKGNKKKADKYRKNFQQTNQWLNQYDEKDIQAMFSYLNL